MHAAATLLAADKAIAGRQNAQLRVSREDPGLAGRKRSRAHMTYLFDVTGLAENGNASTMASADTQH